MTAIPIGILIGMGSDASLSGMNTALPEQMSGYCPGGLSEGNCLQAYMVSQFMVMFMILPLAIPATIAAYSIVGEKTTRSLEPLLATPITTTELLIGKALAASIPGILATYAAFAIFAIASFILVPNKLLLSALLDARWLLAIFVVGPLMALLAVSVSVMVSSRVNDPRVAEQVSMVVLIPILAIFFGQLAGLFVINRQLVLGSAVVLALVDALAIYLAVRLFQREAILTRWK
jgi:ABC-2 type transport system permease protein